MQRWQYWKKAAKRHFKVDFLFLVILFLSFIIRLASLRSLFVVVFIRVLFCSFLQHRRSSFFSHFSHFKSQWNIFILLHFHLMMLITSLGKSRQRWNETFHLADAEKFSGGKGRHKIWDIFRFKKILFNFHGKKDLLNCEKKIGKLLPASWELITQYHIHQWACKLKCSFAQQKLPPIESSHNETDKLQKGKSRREEKKSSHCWRKNLHLNPLIYVVLCLTNEK